MTTLFVDFDGVLHPDFSHEVLLFCQLPLLENLLRSAPDVEIVISSTWRSTRTLQELQGFFSADMAQRVVGVNPHFQSLDDIPDRLLGYEREAECMAQLRTAPTKGYNWIAIDDKPWLFRPFCQNLVATDRRVGIDAHVIDMLGAKLRGIP